MAVAMDWARLRTDNQTETQTGSRIEMLCNGKLLLFSLIYRGRLFAMDL